MILLDEEQQRFPGRASPDSHSEMPSDQVHPTKETETRAPLFGPGAILPRRPLGTAPSPKDAPAPSEATAAALDAALALVDQDAKLHWPQFVQLGSVSELMAHLERKTDLDDERLRRYLQLDGSLEADMRERILADPPGAIEWLDHNKGEPLRNPSRLVDLFVQLLSKTVQEAAPMGRYGKTRRHSVLRRISSYDGTLNDFESAGAANGAGGDPALDDKERSLGLITRVSEIPNLYRHLLTTSAQSVDDDQAADARREAILASIIMRRALPLSGAIRNAESMEWVEQCFTTKGPTRKTNLACIARRYEVLSSLGLKDGDGFNSAIREELLESMSYSFDKLLPLAIGLMTDKEIEQVFDFPLIRQVLDRKLTEPIAMLIVALDGIAVFGVLGCFVGAFTFCPIMTDAGPLSSLEITLLGAAFTCNLWLLSREWIQMRAMIAFRTDVRPIHDPAASDEPHHEHDLPAGEKAATSPAPRTLFRFWATDKSNILEVCTELCTVAAVAVTTLGGRELRSWISFRIAITITTTFLWVNVIKFIRVVNIKCVPSSYRSRLSANLMLHPCPQVRHLCALAQPNCRGS